MRAYLFTCIVMFGLINSSLQIAKIEGDCAKDSAIPDFFKEGCNKILCAPSAERIHGIIPCDDEPLTCGSGKKVFVSPGNENLTYPDCCPKKVCQ